MPPRMRPPFPVRLTDQTFTCAARAHVATAARRTACTHVSRAMQAARRRPVFDFMSRLGRRGETGPRQGVRRGSRRGLFFWGERRGLERERFLKLGRPRAPGVLRVFR